MNRERLRRLLERFRSGALGEAELLEQLATLPFRDLPEVRLDTHRALRQGLPEAVLGEGKTSRQLVRIARALREEGSDVLLTRIDPQTARAVREALPELSYHETARILSLVQEAPRPSGRGMILVVSAGTADSTVAEEAAVTAELYGNKVERLQDVGVAGLHRLLASLELLRRAHVLIVVAGMEGALASVVGGLVERPVIGVPTRVGYGAAFDGITPLLGMLSSCSANVTVVNIDNGFGAAVVATLINRG
ncbi:MAG: nickel pincer cofactor biosynthesis protein LarB [Myxococcota bacterium]